MTGHALIKGLRKINPKIRVPSPQDRYRTPQFKGIVGIYLGEPGAPGSRYITAFHLGSVPEWTQLDENGALIQKGWRAVFEKVVRARAATVAQIERAFRVSLYYVDERLLCSYCLRRGDRNLHNGGAMKMCDFDEQLYRGIKTDKAEAPERELRAAYVKTKEIII
jgi:hypothetical protein